MLETGFDGLVTAALTLVGTAGLLLFLDVKLGLVALCCGPFLAWLTAWFRRESAKTYKVTREKVALVIVHFVESMGGIRAVQAFRREPRNQEIFDDVNDQYRRANLVAFRLVAWFMPGIRLIGNVTIARRAALRRLPRLPRRRHRRRARGVPALPAPVLRADDGDLAVLQHLPVRLGGAGQARRRPRGGAVGARAHRPGRARAAAPAASSASTTSASRTSRAGPVLPDLDLTVPAGQTLALVGTTGAGKTTLAKLATRFYDPTAGSGAARRHRPPRPQLRRPARAVVMVTQENYLFSGTIADNIRFGRPERHHGARSCAATTALGAHDFISAHARRLRHRRRQPGRPAQRRPAAAGRVRPRVPRRPGRADPRRGDLVARRTRPSASSSRPCAPSSPAGPR